MDPINKPPGFTTLASINHDVGWPPLPPSPTLDLYITAEDYGTPDTWNTKTKLPDPILAKLKIAKNTLASSFNIPVGEYTNIFTTSDIHADLFAISRILFNSNITTAHVLDDLSNVFDIKWNPVSTNVLLVIVGDIVDGRRGDLSVNDPIGDIEIKLHIFLYNLRLSAREYNSELRFMIGNHDYMTVIQDNQIQRTPYSYPKPYNVLRDPYDEYKIKESYYGVIDIFYKKYVHTTAVTFFGSRENRKNCLLPFYECCPYICITVDDELIFVHGSLHGGNKGTYNFTDDLIKVQGLIDKSSIQETLGNYSGGTVENIKFIANVNDKYSNYGGPMWSRFYSKGAERDVCKVIKESPYKMTVVGHCQTNNCSEDPGHLYDIINKPPYSTNNCFSDGGCVLLGCVDGSGPRIAFVDISMSRAFDNKGVREEILLLQYEYPKSYFVNRYYTNIFRINTSEDPIDVIRVWPTDDSSVYNPTRGGKRKVYTTRKNKRIRHKKSRKYRG